MSAPLSEDRAPRPIPRRSPVKFRLLFASNPLPMWVYDLETLAFLEVNDAAVAKYGYSADEFLSMRITDIRPPEDVAALLANVAVQRSTLQQSGRWRHRLKSGDIIDVEIVSHSLRFAGRPAALVVAQDVTARLRAEADLAEGEARMRAMLDAALDAIVAIDHEGRITEFNPAAEHMFGWAREDVIGRQIAQTIIPPGLRDRHRQGLGRYLSTGESTILGRRLQLSAVHVDGREFPVELTVHRVAHPGPPTFSAFIRDLTDSRRLEEQLLQAQKMESVGRLAGGIAHDFNNLLTAISGYSQLALDDPDAPPRVKDDLAQVVIAAARAAELTGQLLAFSRRQVMQPIALQMGAEIENLTPMLHRLLREDVKIVTTIDPAVGHVLADPGQLTQVILNLVVGSPPGTPHGRRRRRDRWRGAEGRVPGRRVLTSRSLPLIIELLKHPTSMEYPASILISSVGRATSLSFGRHRCIPFLASGQPHPHLAHLAQRRSMGEARRCTARTSSSSSCT
jgi:two-component system cell cycle sensor histidine kinase/response regulator CckA